MKKKEGEEERLLFVQSLESEGYTKGKLCILEAIIL